MKQHGWRKPTPGLGIAEQLAQAGERLNVPKSRALLAVKRIAAHIGLKASDIMLLDTLGAFTKPQDWEQGRRPIVWASNSYLTEQTGFSLSALKRHARRLADAGVITFKDSPNGKRWGHRDAEGHIVEAYGYDLAPLAARAEAFEMLFLEIKAERQLCAGIKRQITIARRAARAKLETALEQAPDASWRALSEALQVLLTQLPRRPVNSGYLLDLLESFTALGQEIDARFEQRDDVNVLNMTAKTDGIRNPTNMDAEMTPKQSIFEPHILSTNQLNPVTYKSIENEVPQQSTHRSEPTESIRTTEDAPQYESHQTSRKELSLAIVKQACPGFTQIARDLGRKIESWGELHRIAGQIRPMIGMTEHIWAHAQERLGPNVAAAAMALIFDKFTNGDITCPGGYLRGMVKKAGQGELHLARSFFGRLSGRPASL